MAQSLPQRALGKSGISWQGEVSLKQDVPLQVDDVELLFAALSTLAPQFGANNQVGNYLGQFGRGQMVPEFDTAAFSQPVGKVGDPVRSQFGYHLVKVEERKSKALAEMKDQIEKQLRPELAKQEVENVKKANAIGIDDGYFGK